jgi:hypothetical protein
MQWSRSNRQALWIALAVLLQIRVAAAEPPRQQPPDDPPAMLEAQATADGRCSLGASALFGLATGADARPLACLAVLQAGDELNCWTLVDTSRFRPFPNAWLDWITDGKPILADRLEADAFARTLVLAQWTDTAVLDKAGRRDLTYVQLFRETPKYRGQVVRLEGRMKRIRRDDEPPEKAREAGVSHLYEGWMFNDDFGVNPVCCLFTDLPDGLRVSEKMEERVEFAGYLFKRYRYKAVDTPKAGQWREAPLLIGRVVAVFPRATDTSNEWSWLLLSAFLAVIGGTVVFVVLLTLWLRRDDARVRRRLAALAPPPPFGPSSTPADDE